MSNHAAGRRCSASVRLGSSVPTPFFESTYYYHGLLGFFIFYYTASQATLTAPFYTCFSQSLKAYDDVLFPIDPAASPSIIACATLAKRVRFYWFVVFVLVMSLTALPWFAG